MFEVGVPADAGGGHEERQCLFRGHCIAEEDNAADDDEHGLEVADDIEGERRRASDDEEHRPVEQEAHARREQDDEACRQCGFMFDPAPYGGILSDVTHQREDGLDHWQEAEEHARGNGAELVQELHGTHLEFFLLDADEDGIARGDEDGCQRDHKAEKLHTRVGDCGETDSDAHDEDCTLDVEGGFLLVEDALEEHDVRRAEHLADLIEADAVHLDAQVPEDDIADVHCRDGQYGEFVELHRLEEACAFEDAHSDCRHRDVQQRERHWEGEVRVHEDELVDEDDTDGRRDVEAQVDDWVAQVDVREVLARRHA